MHEVGDGTGEVNGDVLRRHHEAVVNGVKAALDGDVLARGGVKYPDLVPVKRVLALRERADPDLGACRDTVGVAEGGHVIDRAPGVILVERIGGYLVAGDLPELDEQIDAVVGETLAELGKLELPVAGLCVPVCVMLDAVIGVVDLVKHVADVCSRLHDDGAAAGGPHFNCLPLGARLVAERAAEHGVAVAPARALVVAVERVVAVCGMPHKLDGLLEVHAHAHVAVGHDEFVGVDKGVAAAVGVIEGDGAGGVSVLDAPGVHVQLHACAAACDDSAAVSRDVERAERAVCAVEHNAVVNVELDVDVDGVIGHGEGVALAEVDDGAAVADLGDSGEVVVISLGRAALHLDGLSGRCGGDLLAVNRDLHLAVGVLRDVDGEFRAGSGLDHGDDGDGTVRHVKAHLVKCDGLAEVVGVDLDGLENIVGVRRDGESDALAGLCIFGHAVADLCGDGGVSDVGEYPAALCGVIVGVDLELRRDRYGEVGHGELAVFHCHGVTVVIICDPYIVEHEACRRGGLHGDLRAGVCLADGGVIDHGDDAAVGGFVDRDLGLLCLLEGDADDGRVGGHDKAVVGDGRGGGGVADLGDLYRIDRVARVGNGDDADDLTCGSGLDALAADLKVKAAVFWRLADEVIVAGAADRAGGRAAAGRAAGDVVADGHNAGNGYVQKLTHAERAEVRPVVERLEHCLCAVVVQTVIRADDVVSALTGAHGVRHDCGVGRARERGVGRGQKKGLSGLNGVDAAEVIELDDLVFIRLVAQSPSGVDTADGLALLDGVGGEVVRHVVAGGQRGDRAGRETAGGRAGDCRAGRSGRNAALCERSRRLIADGQAELRADGDVVECAVAREAVELHDQVFIGIEIYTLRLTDAENRVSLCDGHSGDLRVGGCSRGKHREQGNEHNQHHYETDEPFFHVFAPPNRPLPGRNFAEPFSRPGLSFRQPSEQILI